MNLRSGADQLKNMFNLNAWALKYATQKGLKLITLQQLDLVEIYHSAMCFRVNKLTHFSSSRAQQANRFS